jgi:hypothetical protein
VIQDREGFVRPSRIFGRLTRQTLHSINQLNLELDVNPISISSIRLGVIGAIFISASVCAPAQSHWVHPGSNGKLVYAQSSRGDRIADFSYAGYEGGGVALPAVPAKRTVAPGAEDDSAAIQKAIDEVSALPLVDGFRGAVVLSPGTYHCARTVSISASGVVLRGAGTGKSGTTIVMTGDPHLAVKVSGDLKIATEGAESDIVDDYVPVGSFAIHVADASGFKPGDTLLIRKPVTETWRHYVGMDHLRRNGQDESWIGNGRLDARRRIVAIKGNVLQLDVPLMDSFDARFFDGGHAIACKVTVSGQIAHVGVEDLRIVAPRRSIALGSPEFDGVYMQDAVDSWVLQVATEETTNSFHINAGTERITVQKCDEVQHDPITSAAKPFDYSTNGSQILFDRCTGSGDNVFYFATQARQQGPVVVLHCSFQGNGHIQPHQRWSPGLLLDNCSAPGGGIDLKNRGEMGSGHGWATAWSVAWNNSTASLEMNQAPGVMNWSIGNRGVQSNPPMPTFDEPHHGVHTGPKLDDVVTESPNKPVKPDSLYLQQLKDRLGRKAIENIGY